MIIGANTSNEFSIDFNSGNTPQSGAGNISQNASLHSETIITVEPTTLSFFNDYMISSVDNQEINEVVTVTESNNYASIKEDETVPPSEVIAAAHTTISNNATSSDINETNLSFTTESFVEDLSASSIIYITITVLLIFNRNFVITKLHMLIIYNYLMQPAVIQRWIRTIMKTVLLLLQ